MYNFVLIFFQKSVTMCSQCGGNNNKDPVNLQLIQDVISIKSYVQKLRRILHEVCALNFKSVLKTGKKSYESTQDQGQY